MAKRTRYSEEVKTAAIADLEGGMSAEEVAKKHVVMPILDAPPDPYAALLVSTLESIGQPLTMCIVGAYRLRIIASGEVVTSSSAAVLGPDDATGRRELIAKLEEILADLKTIDATERQAPT